MANICRWKCRHGYDGDDGSNHDDGQFSLTVEAPFLATGAGAKAATDVDKRRAAAAVNFMVTLYTGERNRMERKLEEDRETRSFVQRFGVGDAKEMKQIFLAYEQSACSHRLHL